MTGVSVEKSGQKIIFGRGVILSSLKADPLTYSGDYPALAKEDRTPELRRITLEGYIVSSAATEAERIREIENRRRRLSRITAASESFLIRIGDKYADCSDGELTFDREAPFSGDAAERFRLRAVIDGGFFKKSNKKALAEKLRSGMYFPVSVGEDFTVGKYGGGYAVQTDNGGDVSVGFTAQFVLTGSASSFSLVNGVSGRRISCRYSFLSGDKVLISTKRDELYFVLERGGERINLTGYADEDSELYLLPPKPCELRVEGCSLYSGSVTYNEAFVTF